MAIVSMIAHVIAGFSEQVVLDCLVFKMIQFCEESSGSKPLTGFIVEDSTGDAAKDSSVVKEICKVRRLLPVNLVKNVSTQKMPRM